MAHAPEEEVVFDTDVRVERRRGPLVVLRGLADWSVAALFFAVVSFAALPMGGNRDWAWAPIAVIVGALAVLVAAGVGASKGFEVSAAERKPLLALVACFALFVLFGLFQMSTMAPSSTTAWLYDAAARLLGSAHAPVPDLAIDAARNTLLKCLSCGAIFLIARALCRDRDRARLLLVMFVAGAILVVAYGVLMQVTTHSCYLGSYLKKVGAYETTDRCVMSGTFVSSNSFGCYCGMGMVAAMALIFAGRRRKGDQPYGYDEDDEEGIVASLTGFRVTMLAVCLLLLGGLLYSASRAGLAATLASAAALTVLMLRGRWRSRPDLVRIFVAISVVVGIIVLVIAGNTIVDKAMRASDGGDRMQIWRASLQAVRMSPWLGWGLGSFADIYAIVQPMTLPIPNDLAHSTPLETMVEVGVPMAVVSFAIVFIPWGVSLYGALTRRRAHRYLPGAAFAVAAVPILHSVVDFSLQMPAIGFVVSALMGMGWAQAFGRRERSRGDFTPWE
ncbi:O-antigen ligase like membrane protein [Rhodospirillales bacterium URHD0017]|nr:O-antigen ligase like membrane protein [Rhodospirillales bacterium URHD0017]